MQPETPERVNLGRPGKFRWEGAVHRGRFGLQMLRIIGNQSGFDTGSEHQIRYWIWGTVQ
jgi:hypothetical protein